VRESAKINPEYSETTDAEFQAGVQAGKRKAQQYGRSTAGEPMEQRAYLPVSIMCASGVPSVPATVSLAEALIAMEENQTRHLAVTVDNSIAGMVDEPWLLGWANAFQGNAAAQSLATMELPAFLTAFPETDAHQLAQMMLAHQLDAALIIDNSGKPVGIVTSIDYLRLYANSGSYQAEA
jgi:signal-transduction protein with cAMP-binding, CBS, and nucleotidyltransferase domain